MSRQAGPCRSCRTLGGTVAHLMFTIVALLFVGSVAHVAYVDPQGEVRSFQVPNSEAGLGELTGKLRPVLAAARGKPLMCIGAAEGTSLQGPVFERLAFNEEVRRFMYAQPKYVLEAKAASLPAEDPATLLKLCGSVFPPAKPR